MRSPAASGLKDVHVQMTSSEKFWEIGLLQIKGETVFAQLQELHLVHDSTTYRKKWNNNCVKTIVGDNCDIDHGIPYFCYSIFLAMSFICGSCVFFIQGT